MRTRRLVPVAVTFVILSLACQLAAADPTVALIPRPQEFQCGQGQFVLQADTPVMVDQDSPEAAAIAGLLIEKLRPSTGFNLKPETSAKAARAIRLAIDPADKALGPEGYRLESSPGGVTITGGDGAGLFYGTQTLLQLLPPQVFSPAKVEGVQWAIPAVRIKDQPRFKWRGLLLDVARHFFTKAELKNYIDVMAQHKLNFLQVHWTDDQGWRIEIKRYPRLTEVSAWRKAIDFGLNPADSTAYRQDGCYGGFFTQDELRELVAYAKARYVTIVPEIEMPGHAGGAMSAYPENSCFGGPYDRDHGPMGIVCPGNDEAFTFLQNILAEVIDVFPSKYIHIGGDEVNKATWKKCPKCQTRIKKEGLKDEHELQSYFVKRIERFINSQGRTLIGWDEILEGGLAPNATVMSWRNTEAGAIAARAGHDVVMTPTSHCYFDYYQAPPKTGEPRAIGGLIPLQKVYAYEPMPQGLPADKAKHILGTGGTLWSEFFPNYAQVQYMTYPRACALAEVAWTDAQLKNWDEFKQRLEVQLARLAAEKVRYRAPKSIDPGYAPAGK